MDFDEHDDGDGDEEMAPMPVSSSYEAPPGAPQLLHPGLAHGVPVPKPGDSGGGRFRTPGTGVRYRECLKNHAVGIGGHAVDGCGEFMAAGEEGSIDALSCAACGCHRNFHRKESEESPTAAAAAAAGAITPYGAMPPLPGHHGQFSPYYRTPAGYLHHPQHHHHHQMAAAMAAGHVQRPLALPSTSHSGGRDEAGATDVDMSAMMLSPVVMGSMSMAGLSFGSGGSAGGPSGSGGSAGKKRFRTKFSQEQKERMQAFADRLGWRIQKHDEAAVQQFCEEVGVKRHVLKVWMHNNKHTLGKKPLP